MARCACRLPAVAIASSGQGSLYRRRDMGKPPVRRESFGRERVWCLDQTQSESFLRAM